MQDYSVSKGGKGFKGKDGLQTEKMQVWRSSARCFQAILISLGVYLCEPHCVSGTTLRVRVLTSTMGFRGRVPRSWSGLNDVTYVPDCMERREHNDMEDSSCRGKLSTMKLRIPFVERWAQTSRRDPSLKKNRQLPPHSATCVDRYQETRAKATS